MRTKKAMGRASSKVRVGRAIGLAVLLAAVTAPADLKAQVGEPCSLCVLRMDFGGWWYECGAREGGMFWCSGGTGTECYECEWQIEAASDLAPDGSFNWLDPLPRTEVVATVSRPGVVVLREECSGIIVDRHYTKEAAVKARQATATLLIG